MSQPERYTLPEAAFVLSQPLETLKRVVDRRMVEYRLVTRGGRRARAVDRKTLIFLAFARDHAAELSKPLWSGLYEDLLRSEVAPLEAAYREFRVALEDYGAAVDRRLEALRHLERQVERSADGNPVLRGTEIEIHRIAALIAGGTSVEDVLADYPSLDAERVELARCYAEAHPKLGRSYPGQTAKAAMRDIDLGALDER